MEESAAASSIQRRISESVPHPPKRVNMRRLRGLGRFLVSSLNSLAKRCWQSLDARLKSDSVAGLGASPMKSSIFFHQGCPVCGRMLRIGVHLLGSRVFCQHCGGGFRASDASLAGEPNSDDRPSLSAVDDLLERADLMLQRQSVGDEA